MDNEDTNKAIAYLADKLSKFHSELLAVKRDLKRHLEDTKTHCGDDCDCKSGK